MPFKSLTICKWLPLELVGMIEADLVGVEEGIRKGSGGVIVFLPVIG